MRTSQTLGKYVTGYDWDIAAALPVVLQETRRQDNPSVVVAQTSYVYGLGLISAADASGNQRYYFRDGLGSTTTTINASDQQVVGAYEYDAFGALR